MSQLALETIAELQKRTFKDPKWIRLAGDLLQVENNKGFDLPELNGEKTSVSQVNEIEKILIKLLKYEKRRDVIIDLLVALGKSRNRAIWSPIKKILIRNKFPTHLFDTYLKK